MVGSQASPPFSIHSSRVDDSTMIATKCIGSRQMLVFLVLIILLQQAAAGSSRCHHPTSSVVDTRNCRSIVPRRDASTARILDKLRGGSDPPGYNPESSAASASYASFDPNQSYEDPPYYDPQDHETVQERVDAWRRAQQERYAHASPEQQASVRDADGKIKLLASVGKGSRALIFFVLLWRDVHLYEVADATHKGLVRILLVVPLISLFLANLAGVVASFTSPSHSLKKRMKAILNLDKLVECLLMVYYFFRLTLLPSKTTPREQYIANTLHSVFFLFHTQAFTKLSWDITPPPATTNLANTVAPDDPYQPQPNRQTYQDRSPAQQQWERSRY